jgi:uncharacterized protein involved in exopolysaccharide biosynthesis
MSTDLNSPAREEQNRLDDRDAVSLAPLIRTLISSWRMLLIGGALAAAAGYLLSLSVSAKYVASVLAAPSAPEEGGTSLASLASRFGALGGLVGGSLGTVDSKRAALVASLTSRQFVDRFIAEHQIDKLIFARHWDAKAQLWKKNWLGRVPTPQDSFEYFIRHVLTVDEDKRTGLIRISMRWKSPQSCAMWANAYVKEANQDARDRAMQEANQSIEHLTREMARMETVEVRQSMASLMESQLDKRMVATVRPDYALRIIDPAVAPDLDKFVSPQRWLYSIAGGVLGVLVVLTYGWRRDQARR